MNRSFSALTCLMLAFVSYNASAQSAPQTVIASAGNFATFANGSMTWTIGEVMTETYSPTGYFFTQGFNQPDTMYLTVISEHASQTISVYPNPVVENLVIDFSMTSGDQIIEIVNMQGQLLRRESVSNNQTRIHISFKEFSNGIYFLNVINAGSSTRTSYKINKAE